MIFTPIVFLEDNVREPPSAGGHVVSIGPEKYQRPQLGRLHSWVVRITDAVGAPSALRPTTVDGGHAGARARFLHRAQIQCSLG